MRSIVLALVVVLGISVNNIWAGNNSGGTSSSSNSSNVRYVKAPRFARPLLEKWISEYSKTQPGVEFQIAKGSNNQGNIDLNVVFDDQDGKTEDFSHSVVYFGEFAVLPITASGSEAAKVLEGKHLNAQDERALIDARNRMNNEIAVALNMEPDGVAYMIHEKTGLEDFA